MFACLNVLGIEHRARVEKLPAATTGTTLTKNILKPNVEFIRCSDIQPVNASLLKRYFVGVTVTVCGMKFEIGFRMVLVF